MRAKQIKKKVEVRRDAKGGPGRPAAANQSGGERSPGGGGRPHGGSDGKASGPATEYDAEQRILVLGDGDFSFSRGVYVLIFHLTAQSNRLFCIVNSWEKAGEFRLFSPSNLKERVHWSHRERMRSVHKLQASREGSK